MTFGGPTSPNAMVTSKRLADIWSQSDDIQYLHKGNPAESRICLPHRSTCQSCRSNGKVRPKRLPKRALGVNSPGRPRKRMSLGSLHSSSCKRSYFRISLIEKNMLDVGIKLENWSSYHQVWKIRIHVSKLRNGLVSLLVSWFLDSTIQSLT